ncbi:CcoQ/FixQ family Cbb3-type cytochrome c oxidase assembly chaperone [Lysobacter sp. F60174L2]|uniref:CcoQ/FixQ family Cbb3-type cytochrome c oxidase assembly chaperone n=1 Tax=Lysobacter sp. F60174L2 TaxID=3459295 RepID=UPI00403D79FF
MLSGLITLGLLLVFVAIWAWAWQPRHKASFDATARLALEDDESEPATREDRP